MIGLQLGALDDSVLIPLHNALLGALLRAWLARIGWRVFRYWSRSSLWGAARTRMRRPAQVGSPDSAALEVAMSVVN
jgi:hypothetical protein